MSHGGPEVAYREPDGSVTAYCSEESDYCEFGEHKRCSGQVEHRTRLEIVDRVTGNHVGLLGNNHVLLASHMCNCRCHWEI